MKLFIHMLIWAMPTVLLVGGCSKKKAPEEISDGPDEIGEETVALPKQTKPKSIARLDDGLWHENADGKIFTGTIVHEEDSLRAAPFLERRRITGKLIRRSLVRSAHPARTFGSLKKQPVHSVIGLSTGINGLVNHAHQLPPVLSETLKHLFHLIFRYIQLSVFPNLHAESVSHCFAHDNSNRPRFIYINRAMV